MYLLAWWLLRYQSETLVDSRSFRYRTHFHGHTYSVIEFLCRFIVHLELNWLDSLLPGNCSQILLCFKNTDSESPGIRLPRVWSRLTKLVSTRFSFLSLPCMTPTGTPTSSHFVSIICIVVYVVRSVSVSLILCRSYITVGLSKVSKALEQSQGSYWINLLLNVSGNIPSVKWTCKKCQQVQY